MEIQKEIVYMSENDLPIKAKMTDSSIENISSSPHIHKEIELIYLQSGSMLFFIEDKKIELKSEDIIFINNHIAHSTVIQESDFVKLILLQFDPNIVYNLGRFYELKYLLAFMSNNSKKYYHFKKSNINHNELKSYMINIIKEFLHKQIAYEISVKSMLYGVLAILYRSNALDFVFSRRISERQESLLRISKVLVYLEENYEKDIGVEGACKMLNLNYHYFCRLFRKATGKSFTEYLNFIRIAAAEKLMISTDMKLTDIVLETGFSSISYFNKVFKTLKGTTPSNYRKNILK